MHVKRRLTEREDSTGDHSATDIPLERWHCDKLNKHPRERQKEQGGGVRGEGDKDNEMKRRFEN